MSEPSRLQRKIVQHLSQPPIGEGAGQGVGASDVPPLRVAFPEHTDAERELGSSRISAFRPALACAGLLASAAIVAAGLEADLFLLPFGLGIAGIAGSVLLFSDWRQNRNRRGRGAAYERSGDRAWEAREAGMSRFAIHDALGDMAILRDAKGVILEANDTFRTLTGAPSPEGQRCDALGLELRPPGTSGRYRVEIMTEEGSTRIFDWHDVLTREAETGTLRIVSVGRDITDNVSAARSSEAALQRAEAESRAKSHLLATVSHEIRTPLSGILGMSDLLDQTRLSAQQANYLAGMRQSGHDLVQLVDDLLDCASMEAGRFALRPTRQSLRPLVESVVEMLSHRAHAKGIEIASTIAADVPDTLKIDGPRLKQVLFNVVGNAVKFTTTGGVLVSCAEQNGALVLRVTDTGPGMTFEDQSRIFDAFEQAGDTVSQSGGTGLGLAISRRIIRAFGGDVTVSSRLGVGSLFEIRFPLTESVPPLATARTRTLSTSRVLLIAPKGPASEALAATVETLGGRCRIVSTIEQAGHILKLAMDGGSEERLTDIIVDHRCAALFRRICKDRPDLENLPLRRTYLVNPEERIQQPLHQTDGFHAWLIRPLRERSLVAVLKGQLKGIEVRDAINDNRPILRDAVDASPAPAPLAVCTVLLGEDDPVNAAILRATLERAGYAVRHVVDFAAMGDVLDLGLSAAAAGDGQAPRILITDLNMPGGDGVTLVRRLRLSETSIDGALRLPVIVQTSDRRPETHRDLLEAGADAVLAKPANPKILIELVGRLIAG
ncbi:ATP-binding protein [Rhizobium sp. NFR03]|uniref:hybrid sensor histidine kinase/response regulator n=1 Tax=Rhizobium sp. NFR03 TaxID=1566263 RepID=UPI0008BAD826|nr:ATP-binding protein [Rhizobium sp. NFR03]SER88718.1 Signal transduction histidine kinase [Rhizobium sp. NFR03]